MTRKGENIYKRLDGRYEARYVKERNANNKIIKYGYVYGKTYKEAKMKKYIALYNIKDKTKNDYLNSQKTFKDEIDYWFQNKLNIKESTIYNYYTIVYSKIIPYFDNKKIKDINNETIKKYTNYLINQKLSHKRIKDILIVLNQFFTDVNLNIKITYPKINKTSIKTLTDEEILIIEKNTLESNDIKNFIICLVLYTGLRIGEVCALKWKDIDLDNQLIYISKTATRVREVNDINNKTRVIIDYPKTEKSIRVVPIHKELISYLKKFKKDDDLYVLTSTKEFLPTNVYYYYYKKIMRKLNLKKDYNFHILRHTFATRSLLNGIDIKTLSEILGHSSVRITLDRYVHVNTNEKINQINRLPFLKISSQKSR